MNNRKQRKTKGKNWFLLLIIIAVFLLVLLLIIMPHGKRNYLFIGMDNYGSLNDVGRSDTILLVHLDFDRHNIGLVTFARDILLNYKGKDQKINTIVRLGGEEALVDVIKDSFNVSIDGWFRLNFSSFISIIDEIGGVTVELTDAEARYITNQVGVYPDHPLSEGECLLNGDQSLSYARCRRLDNDFGRGNRASKLANALIRESSRMSIRKIIDLFYSMKHAWRSDLSSAAQIRLICSALWLRHAPVTRVGIPFEKLYHYGNSSTGDNGVILYLDRNVERLHDAIAF